MVKSLSHGWAFCWLLLMVCTPSAVAQVDTDGDGLLDVLDAPGFDANASDTLSLGGLGIEDLDGVNELTNLQRLDLDHNRVTSLESGDFDGLTNLQTLRLDRNQITSIESRDFDGMANLRTLWLLNNQITSIESGAFEGLTNLETLFLHNNQTTSIESGAFEGLTNLKTLALFGNEVSELNFTGAMFEKLRSCLSDMVIFGFCVDGEEITRLTLDDATLSASSFDVIVGETTAIFDASLVGLTFSDSNPPGLSDLLDTDSLDNILVGPALFDLYADEFNAFDAVDGNTVTVILEGDCNKDGLFSASDLACVKTISSRDVVLTALNTLPGDVDGDGDVAFNDFLVLSANFGQDVASYAGGNIDLQEGIGFADFLILSNNFDKTPSDIAAVPEPNAFFLVWLGLLGIVSFRRRDGN